MPRYDNSTQVQRPLPSPLDPREKGSNLAARPGAGGSQTLQGIHGLPGTPFQGSGMPKRKPVQPRQQFVAMPDEKTFMGRPATPPSPQARQQPAMFFMPPTPPESPPPTYENARHDQRPMTSAEWREAAAQQPWRNVGRDRPEMFAPDFRPALPPMPPGAYINAGVDGTTARPGMFAEEHPHPPQPTAQWMTHPVQQQQPEPPTPQAQAQQPKEKFSFRAKAKAFANHPTTAATLHKLNEIGHDLMMNPLHSRTPGGALRYDNDRPTQTYNDPGTRRRPAEQEWS